MVRHPFHRWGFTLIELMIVVAVISILATIAYPSYQDYIRKARRIDAQSVMLDIQLQQEKYRVNHVSYGSLTDVGSFPSDYYTFAISGNTASAYTITATAKSGTSQAGDTGCTPMYLIKKDENDVEVGEPIYQQKPELCWKK